MLNLSYDDYVALGGKLDVGSFLSVLPSANAKINYCTAGRFGNLTTLESDGDMLKILIVKVIDLLSGGSSSSVAQASNLTGYSNGIETFQFGDVANVTSSTNKVIKAMCNEFLMSTPELISRRVVQYANRCDDTE